MKIIMSIAYKIRDIFEVNDNDFYSEEPYIQDENSCYFLLGELLDDKYYHIFNHIIVFNFFIF